MKNFFAAVLTAYCLSGAALAAEPEGWPFSFHYTPSIVGRLPTGVTRNPVLGSGTRHESFRCSKAADGASVFCNIVSINIRFDAIQSVPSDKNNTMFFELGPAIDPQYQLESGFGGNVAGVYSPTMVAQLGMDTVNNSLHDTADGGALWAITCTYTQYYRPVNATWASYSAPIGCTLGGDDGQFTTLHIRIEGSLDMQTSTALFDTWFAANLMSGAITLNSVLPPDLLSAALQLH